jgi:hypothetical protein
MTSIRDIRTACDVVEHIESQHPNTHTKYSKRQLLRTPHCYIHQSPNRIEERFLDWDGLSVLSAIEVV